MIIIGRNKVADIINRIKSQQVCLPIFCTASHWNTEAILVAAKNIGEKFNIDNVPVAIAMTYNYKHMPQAQRITYDGNPRLGFLSMMCHLKVLSDDPKSPYYHVQVLPHLDHADPVHDNWPLTKGTEYLASVMFDAQKFPLRDNIKLTREYVRNYKTKVYIEGIMDELNVSVADAKSFEHINNYPERALHYVNETGIDFLVADLGTEQQSIHVKTNVYLKQRARDIQKLLADRILVLHGTSCLSNEELMSLSDDGILRVNMWTRIVREAGLYAIDQLSTRKDRIKNNDFDAIESNQYLKDSTRKAAQIMEEIMVLLGYDKLI